ncbi:hypothetical protein BANRA_00001 [Klebsiella pneumoniae]|nr:hypothetical protein BANRA_00001 [Klebsiella pneumoniae]
MTTKPCSAARRISPGWWRNLGLEVNVVPHFMREDWPLGVTSGKYDAAIAILPSPKSGRSSISPPTAKSSLGFYVKSTSPLSKIDKAEDIAGLKVLSAPAPTERRSCWRGTQENVRRAEAVYPGLPRMMPPGQLALQTGRADAFFGPNVIGAWTGASQTGGQRRWRLAKSGAHRGNAEKGRAGECRPGGAEQGYRQRGLRQSANRWGEGVEAFAIGNQSARTGRLTGARWGIPRYFSGGSGAAADY